MPVSGLPPYDSQHLRPHPARRNPLQESLRGRVRARVPRHHSAGADACPGGPEGRILLVRRLQRRGQRDEIAGFIRAVGKIAKDLGLEASGYRLLANMGEHSGQEVPHFHVHLFAGRPLGRMISV